MTGFTNVGNVIEPRGPAANKGDVAADNMTAAEANAWLARRKQLQTEGNNAGANRGDHARDELTISHIKCL